MEPAVPVWLRHPHRPGFRDSPPTRRPVDAGQRLRRDGCADHQVRRSAGADVPRPRLAAWLRAHGRPAPSESDYSTAGRGGSLYFIRLFHTSAVPGSPVRRSDDAGVLYNPTYWRVMGSARCTGGRPSRPGSSRSRGSHSRHQSCRCPSTLHSTPTARSPVGSGQFPPTGSEGRAGRGGPGLLEGGDRNRVAFEGLLDVFPQLLGIAGLAPLRTAISDLAGSRSSRRSGGCVGARRGRAGGAAQGD